MPAGFTFWAQSLDNSTPDVIEVSGVNVASDESDLGQTIVSRVTDVIEHGNQVRAGRVRLTASGNMVVVEMPSEQTDNRGRSAPIVCIGEFATGKEAELVALMVDDLRAFAQRRKRTISHEDLQSIRPAFEAYQNLIANERTKRKVVIGAIMAAATIIGEKYRRTRKRKQAPDGVKNPNQSGPDHEHENPGGARE